MLCTNTVSFKRNEPLRLIKILMPAVLIQAVLLYVFAQFWINTQQSRPDNTKSIVLNDFAIEMYPEFATTPKVIVIVSGEERYFFLTLHQRNPIMNRYDAWEKLQHESELCIDYVDDVDVVFKLKHTVSAMHGYTDAYLRQENFNSYRESARTVFLVIIIILELMFLAMFMLGMRLYIWTST